MRRVLATLGIVLLLGGCGGGSTNYDLDGDGSLDSEDCAPDDPAIHPGAVEIVGDGIDQDCLGGDLVCDVIERTPRYEHSGYTRQLSWVDQDVYQVRRVEFYDRRGGLLKTLTLEDYRQYDASYWRPHLMAMVNHQTGKSTDLVYSEYEFKSDISDRDFQKGVLQRQR